MNCSDFPQTLQLENGVVTLSMDEIKTAYPDTRTLVGKTIYIKASVLTQTGRESSDDSVRTRCSQVKPQAFP